MPAALPTLSRATLSLWWLLVIVWVSYVFARSRAREERSDRRAVELSGDPEAVVRALVKLHTYSRAPRRWDVDVEREATHPSLARRIQAIRRLAGHPTAPEAAVAFPLSRPGGFVIFSSDRIAWLEGMAPGTPADPDVLRSLASRTQEIPYGDLIELRVKGSLWSPPKIIATDKRGLVRTFPIRPADLAGIQAVLDRADLHLAPLPPPLQFELTLVRVFLVGGIFFVTHTPRLGHVIDANIFLAFLLPVPTSLAMLAAATVAHAFALVTRLPYPRYLAIALALVVVAVAVLWERHRLARRAVYRSRVSSVVLPLVLGGIILAASWALTYLDFDLASDWPSLDDAIGVHPDAWIAAASLAGGLLSLRSRWTQLAGLLLLVCAIVLVAIGKRVIPVPFQ